MKRTLFASTLCFAAVGGALLLSSTGCGRSQPVAMAPPVSAPPPVQAAQGGSGGVYQWQDVPAGQQVPITRAVFDQGGYQLYAQTGDTIVVPFANENLYVMKFGQSGTGQMYFVQDGSVPTLYVPRGAGLENASAQGARWYPFSQDYQYQRPVYVGIAPSWSQFTGMGWYPGMNYYGGYWGNNPYGYSPMVGLMFNIGGRPYYGWNSYTNYYRSNPGYIRPTRSFNYASTGRTAPGSFGRNRGTGSFGSSRSSGGFSSSRPTSGSGGTGSFGSSRTSSGGGFSSSRPGSGSFGSSNRNNTFGTSSNRPAFGSGSSSSGSSSSGSGFGSFGRRNGSSGSFGSSSGGSSSSGYRPFGSSRSSGGSFGGSSSGSSSGFGRSSGSSSSGFGRSSGGSSFGGSRSSGGFGGGRRR